MTTTPAPSFATYPLTGSAVGPFATGFRFADGADVRVSLTVAGVTGADLTGGGVDYTLTADAPLTGGGTVNLAVGLVPAGGWAADTVLVLTRRTPRRQSLALPDTEGHKPRATEAGLDRAMRIAEELSDGLGHSLLLPPGLDGGAIPWTPALGERFVTIGADGRPGVVIKPDDFDGLNKVNRNADNVTPAFIDQVPYRLSAAAQIRAVGDKLDGLVMLEDYYASGMAWADVFDIAFADVDELNIAGTIYAPADNILLGRTVVIPFGRIRIEGQDKGATVFRCDHNEDGFLFKAPGGGSYLNSGIAMCSVQRVLAGTPTSGAVVTFDGVGAAYATDIEGLNFWRGVGFLGNNRACMVYDCGFSDIEQTWLHVEGGGNQYVSRCDLFQNIERPDSIGIALRDTEGVWLDQVKSSRAGTGLKVAPGAGQRVQDIYASLCSLDASHRDAAVFDINAVNSIIRNVMIDECSFSASGQRGIVATGAAGRLRTIKINNSFVNLNQDDGVFLDAGTDWYFDQTAIQNNGNGGGIANRDGIRLGNCGVVVVDECPFSSFDPGDPTWNPVRQKYAVHATPTFAGDFRMSKSNLNDQVTAPVLNEGTGVFEVLDSPGYNRTILPSQTVTITVPSAAYPTLAAALSGIARWEIRGSLIIQMAFTPGTPITYAQAAGYTLTHPDGLNITIQGNPANRADVVLEWPLNTVAGFYVGRGKAIKLKGLTLQLSTHVGRAGGGAGVLGDNGSQVYGDAILIKNFFYSAAARHGAVMEFTASHSEKAGDVGWWASRGGVMRVAGCTAANASTVTDDVAYAGLGSGFAAEWGAALDATGAEVTGGCFLAGFTVYSGGSARLNGSSSHNNLGSGYDCRYGGTIEAHSASSTNNAGWGVRRARDSSFTANGFTATGNTLGQIEEIEGYRVAVPATATSPGVPGQYAMDASWLYVCHGVNTWRRTATATF